MADAKIINYGQQISAGSTAIPDNVEVALDIETTAGEDWILIDTENGAENMVLAGGNYPVMIGSDQRGPRMRDGHGSASSVNHPVYTFRGDTDTGMTHLGTSNDDCLALVAGGQEGIRITEAGDAISAVAINGVTTVKSGASGAAVDILQVQNSNGDVISKLNSINTNGGEFVLYRAGTPAIELDAQNGSYFNNAGMGIDFRIESDNEEYMFNVDGSEDSVAIGAEVGVHKLHVQDGNLGIVTNSADAVSKELVFTKSRHATDGSHTPVEDDDLLGGISFQGSNGSAFIEGASITAKVNGDLGSAANISSISAAGAGYTATGGGTPSSTTATSGVGSGMTVSITVGGSGEITGATVQLRGKRYVTGDTVTVDGGSSPATLVVAAQTADMPTELILATSKEGSGTPSTRLSIGANGVMASTTDSASCFAFGRTGQADKLEIRSSNGSEFNTAGVKSIKFMQSYKEIADFNEETLVLENLNYPYSGTNGGLWVDLPNTCTSSGTDNKVIACTAHGLQKGDAVALPSGDGNIYEVFKVYDRGSANQFTVDSALTNAITNAVGNTDGNKLVVKTGHGDTRFQVKGSGNTQITSGQRQLELFQEDGLVRYYFDDVYLTGLAGSGSDRIRFSTGTDGSYSRYSALNLGDVLTTSDAQLHVLVGADTSDRPAIKISQTDTTNNPYGLEINNTGSGDSIRDDSGAKLTAAGVWTDASDVLHKEEIVDIPYGLAEVLQMQPRKYKLKKTGEEDIGFISQEMEAIIPEVVFGDDAVMQDKVVDVTAKPAKLDENGEEIDPAREEKARFNVPTGGKSLSYSHLTAVLVKAVQELTARIEQLEGGD
jgi:hypothetical protein